jgi:hypothetical protein
MRRLGLLFLALAVFASSAHGFETTKGGTVGAPASASGPSAAKGVGLEGREADARPQTKPMFSLPGIGTLGVLPKLDFGLELLYGEAPSSTREAERKELETDPEDLTIKGTFKHRF